MSNSIDLREKKWKNFEIGQYFIVILLGIKAEKTA